jgi:hypothetical protein
MTLMEAESPLGTDEVDREPGVEVRFPDVALASDHGRELLDYVTA